MKNKHLALVLGEIIRNERQLKTSDTLEQAGERANLDGTNLGRIERGEQEPQLRTFIKVLNAYDIDLLQYKERTSKAIQLDEEAENRKHS